MTRVNTILSGCIALAALVLGCSSGNAQQDSERKPIQPARAQMRQSEEPEKKGIQPLKESDEVAVITTNQGEIIIRFYPSVAPNHVKNFISLAKSKFFDGTTFHRIIPGFMIQGGDPNSKDENLEDDGAGGGPRTLMAEFSDIHHRPGIVSAARKGGDIHSATSQFFIMVAEAPHLDGQYTVFGEVVEGMDVANRIVELPRLNKNNNPGKAALVRSVRIEKAGDVLDFPLDEN